MWKVVSLAVWIIVSDTIYHMRYKFNCSIRTFLLNVQDQHLTIHELPHDEIEFMIHDIAVN